MDKPTNRRRPKVRPPLPPRLAGEVGVNTLLKVGDLKVDHTYQRPPLPRHIEAIANALDLKRLFRIAVNQRPDGSYWIIDGQQRVGAIRLYGDDNFMIDCVVYHLKTMEDEADLYRHLNWDRVNPTPFDRWRALLAQGEPDIVRIQRELDDAQIRLCQSGMGFRTLKSVGALTRWIEVDPEVVSVVIMILGQFDLHEQIGVEVFGGLCLAEHHLRKRQHSLTRARGGKETFANFLVSKGYHQLKMACNRFQGERHGLGGGGSSGATKAAKGIIDLLNYHLRSGKLPQIEE